ncbi:cof-like hydrolase [Propionibacterium sp. oral taxon 192 str. F0372]|uniref:HAD hydrolase family protein n=1 Tax=Propionibacterium sp. oral taxon 192 TaxID=671222 RepID=UPI0003529D34|nr:HAD hydrolase family protein [Propionibacterium sp. oral taxon 192]EPH00402.1 cof-like hydrolase [Propionibacterium sp. oral taxon 192 str. F0372]
MVGFDVIATDLDGTFLSSDRRIPELNAQALQQAHAAGIKVIYATGRPRRWLPVITGLTDVPSWAVTANGAVTIDMSDGSVVFSHTADPTTLRSVCQQVREACPEARFVVEYLDGWSAEPQISVGESWTPPDNTADIDILLTREGIVKLLVQDPSHPTKQLFGLLSPIIGDRLEVTYSHDGPTGLLEMTAPGVSKAGALLDLLGELGTAPERMVAFGDMPNDLAMLRLAGRGFAMAGADPVLVEAGIPVIGSNDDAAVGAKILELLAE